VELGLQRTATVEQRNQPFSWLYERLPSPIKDSLGKGGWSICVSAVNSGKAVILLDGLDELEPDAQKQLRDLVSRLKGNQLVLSSRPHVYRLVPFEGFASYALQGLQPRHIDLLAGKACHALAREFGADAPSARAKVLEVARGPAAAIAANPLLLSFLCLNAILKQSFGGDSGLRTRTAAAAARALTGPRPRRARLRCTSTVEVARCCDKIRVKTDGAFCQKRRALSRGSRKFGVRLGRSERTGRHYRLRTSSHESRLTIPTEGNTLW
jgi:hypothetical protein